MVSRDDPLLDMLRKPIDLPDPDFAKEQAAQEVATLLARRKAFEFLASIDTMPQWGKIVQSLTEIRNQYTSALLSAKGRDVVRLQEAVKSYDFLIDLPNKSIEQVSGIDSAIGHLREFLGLGD